MKKGLSVLLIAAALFGFYGGAVNLNDVLACKDYWEKAGEESTANMNKLEDGLNQLKENEQAYLDGKDQVAEGEKTLAEGEQTLADGEAQYEKGLADYAAAPAKLADARKQIAAGEAALADGQNSINGLTKLINGIKKLRSGYNDTWRPGYEKLKNGRAKISKGVNKSYDDLEALAVFLDESDRSGYLAALKDVGKDDAKQTAKDYKDYIKSTNTMATDLPKIQKSVKQKYQAASALLKYLKAQKTNFDFAKAVSIKKKDLLTLTTLIETANNAAAANTYKEIITAVANAYDSFDNNVDDQYNKYLASEEGQQTEAYLISQNMDNGWAAFFASDDGKAAVSQAKQGIALVTWQKTYGKSGSPSTEEEKAQYAAILANITDDNAKTYIKENSAEAKAGVEAGVKKQVDAGIKETVKQKVLDDYNSTDGTAGAQLTAAKVGLTQQFAKSGDGGVIGIVVANLKSINEKVNGKDSDLKNVLLPGLKEFNKAATSKAIDKLTDGQNTISSGVATVASAVLGNSTLKAGVKKNFGSKAITLLRKYKKSSGPLSSSRSDFAKFEKQMDKTPGVESFLKKAQKLLAKTKADGISTLNAGKKKLAAGKAQYAQGLADYAAAPAKLADAEQQLADGRQQLADGRQALADGKAQLAQYEDGEQQVRDGLATLAGTEADLDLESIADRLGGDTDFDNGDEHLELDEGLAAVEIGRGYQAEDGVLITEEITARAVGTAGLLAAGALAVLAAILSFLKKNKGAGVFAILAAAAGAFGAYYGSQAGTYFSSIAGSTAGATGWTAAGILAAVALVHAVVHFTAKKEA